MSKAATKKGADKTKPPASQTPIIAHEIVPGKFTDNDCFPPYNQICMINFWNTMVDRDSSDEFILDIMDELVANTMAKIQENYIQKQLLPFTITQARDAIVEIIEWQFLTKDEGEVDIESDIGWAEDEEPEPATTDCWAQGSVPCNNVRAPTPQLEVIVEVAEQEENLEQQDTAEPASLDDPPELPDIVSDTEETPLVKEISAGVVKESPPPKKGSKKKFKPYRGKLKSAGVSKLTESLEESEMNLIYNEVAASLPQSDNTPSTLLNMPASCTSILKVQTGRPPGNKDVVYDELGNVVAVMKLDPEKLPTHNVSVRYHVVDPAVEAAQARLDAMRKGKSTGTLNKKNRHSKTSSMESLTNATSKHGKNSSGTKMAPLPPPLHSADTNRKLSNINENKPGTRERIKCKINSQIDEMEVSHGVVVKEGGRVKKGPGRYYRKHDNLEDNRPSLQPVAVRVNSSSISVADLLDRHTPILRPLGESGPLPLPPILPHPPAQRV